MKVTVGKLAGFCGGVTNSVNKTYKLLENNKDIYCLGELVHNQQVVDELTSMGLKFIESLEEVPLSSKVIIRAHGVNLDTYKRADELKHELFDLTCPKVLAIHDLANKLQQEGNFVVLVAQENHPEAIGTISFCGDDSLIIENIEEVELLDEKFKNSNRNKIAVISQTTFSVKKFNDICELICSRFDNVEVHNTICLATSKRQEETDNLSKEVDAMIIIGGANSSNTKKLYEVAKNNNENTFIVQTVDELEGKDFSSYKHIGVMAGASTPKQSIDEVVNFLEEIN